MYTVHGVSVCELCNMSTSVAKGVAHKALDLASCKNNTIDDATVATPLPIAPSPPSSVLQHQ